MGRARLVRRLVAALLVLTARAAKDVGRTFCSSGYPASTNDFDICCASTCGICTESQCRDRDGGPLNCCPLSGILPAGEECTTRRQESCAVRRPASGKDTAFKHFLHGDAPAGKGPVHVAIAGDHVHYVGLVAAAQSVFKAAADPGRIRLRVLAEPGDELRYLRAALECSLGPPATWSDKAERGRDVSSRAPAGAPRPRQAAWEIVLFNASEHFPANLTIRAPNNAQKGNLAADLNYARFYLPDLLPDVEKIVYLDADTVVAKDVAKLYDSALVEGDSVLAAVPRDGKSVCFSMLECEDEAVRAVLRAKGIAEPERDLNFFNAGVAVFHLGRWAKRRLTREVEFWIAANSEERPIYALGSNPPLILAVGRKFERIDPKWNCDGFGFKRPTLVSRECQLDAGIRHWSGHLKPWRRDGKYKHMFYPAVSDLNCLLKLPAQQVEYDPEIEVDANLRVVLPEEGGTFPLSAGRFGAADRRPERGEAALGPVAFGATEEEDFDAAVLAKAAHKEREYKSVQSVKRAMEDSLKRYAERERAPGAARAFIAQLRSHPSVSWEAWRNRSAHGQIDCHAVDHVLVIVDNATLYVDNAQYGPGRPCGPAPPKAAGMALKMLYAARAAVPLPDTYFILCVNPLGTPYRDVPVLSFVKTQGASQPGILVPGPHFMKGSLVNWERAVRRYEESALRYPWPQRSNVVYWRGRFAGVVGWDWREAVVARPCDDVANLARLEAISATLRHDDVANLRMFNGMQDAPYVFGPHGGGCVPRWDEHVHRSVRDIVKTVQARAASHRAPRDGKPRPMNPNVFKEPVRNLLTQKTPSASKYMTHKFVASLPGAGGAAPPARNEIWVYGAAVLLWRSEVQEWYYPGLVEGSTHVTIDGRNIVDTVRMLQREDKRAQRLALAAQTVYENHLCPACLLETWRHTLLKYNSRFGLDDVDIPNTLDVLSEGGGV